MFQRLLMLALGLALAMPAAAGMIGTPAGGESERERVKALLERPEVAAELERQGVTAQEAKARVGAMSDAEASALAGRIDAMNAGGQRLSGRDLLLIGLLVVLLILLL